MKWIIELYTGKKIIEGKDLWDISIPFKRIYLTDGTNEYGFFPNGLFFINNKIFDFKIKIDDCIIPIQFKTGMMKFSPSFSKKNDIVCWNIGFECGDYKYILRVMYNYQIFLEATKKENDIINNRTIKLQ